MNTGQYFFSKEKLSKMLAEFDSEKFKEQVGGRELKGFVFTAGRNEEGEARAFAFPLFSPPEQYPENATTGGGGVAATGNISSGTILYQNTAAGSSGCPYPPPCK
jgi:hypothetical protein